MSLMDHTNYMLTIRFAFCVVFLVIYVKGPSFFKIKTDVLSITSALGRLCLLHHQCLLQTLIMFVTVVYICESGQ